MDSNKQEDLKAAPLCCSARLVLVLEATFGFFMLYLLRTNFSLAIVCMTRTPDVNEFYSEPTNTTENSSFSQKLSDSETLPVAVINMSLQEPTGNVCGNLSSSKPNSEGEFYWEKNLQGLMLSSFFWGYIITQIPGGWLATKIGGKHVLGVGMFIGIVANLLIPMSARINPYLVIILRFIMGLGHGVIFPSMHGLWGRWAPPLERSKLIASTYAGTLIGTVLALSVSGFLCVVEFDNGWPLIFYIYGLIGVIWYILWNILVFNIPAEHPRISVRERLYIEQSIGHSTRKKNIPIPWKSMLTSGPLWAIVVGHMGNNWGAYTILTCIPMYMKEVLHFDIKSNGMLVAMPYVLKYVTTIFSSHMVDLIRSKHILTTATVRKLCQTLANLVPGVFIIAVGYMDCERRHLAVTFLTLAVAFTAFCRSGYLVNHVDIAPRFSGVLFGISNTFATIPGMISPYLTAALTKNGTQEEWQIVFYICGGVHVFGCIVYILLASGEEQSWAKGPCYDKNDMIMEVKPANTLEENVVGRLLESKTS